MVQILQPAVKSEFEVRFRDNRGVLVDVTIPTLTVFDFTNVQALSTTSGFTAVSTGRYRHLLDPSVLTTIGTYRAIYSGTYNGHTIFADSPELFEIKALADVYVYASVRQLVDYSEIAEPVDALFLKDLLTVATQLVNTYCGREFRRYTISAELHVLKDHEVFHLREYPVVSITTFTIEDDAVATTEYRLDKATGRIRFEAENRAGDAEVTYVAGVDTVPHEVSLACLKIASFLYMRRKREGVSGESLLGYRYDLWNVDDPVIKDVKSLLDPYKHVDVH